MKSTNPKSGVHTTCSCSTSIDDETLTFGRGKIDGCGFWEIPCYECAAEFKAKNPEYKVWPSNEESWE